MPCILKVRIISVANLDFEEKTSSSCFVEIKFGAISGKNSNDYECYKTSTVRKTSNPIWNEDFRLEIIDETDLQVEPLQLKLMDSSGFIGGCIVDLSLLLGEYDTCIAGEFPLLDTVDGVKGSINLQAKLLYFGETNSSNLIQFFSAKYCPAPYRICEIIGLVDVMLCENDPEYHWSDSFRATRTSNESRNNLLYKMTGELKECISRKVSEMGGNGVIGYSYSFDFESHSTTIVARGIGTAVKLFIDDEEELEEASNNAAQTAKISSTIQSPLLLPSTMELLTIKAFPTESLHLIQSVGGCVASKAVKLLTGTEKKRDREQWLFELREDIKTHAKTLKCSHVMGYSEQIVVSNDLMVLSAVGTAVLLDVSLIKASMFCEDDNTETYADADGHNSPTFDHTNSSKSAKSCRLCSIFHIPYHRYRHVPFEMDYTKCNDCKKRYVPQILLSTSEFPSFYKLGFLAAPAVVDAHVCRLKQSKEGETNAVAVSDAIPFIEYDIHRQLLYKMRMKGFNAIFDLNYRFEVGSDMIVMMAVGTGYFIPALPRATPLKITRSLGIEDDEDRALLTIQDKLMQQSLQNRAAIDRIVETLEEQNTSNIKDLEDSSDSSTDKEDLQEIIEIDDDTDEDLMCVLIEPVLSSIVSIVSSTEDSYLPQVESSAEKSKIVEKFLLLSDEKQISHDFHHCNRQLSELFKGLLERIESFVCQSFIPEAKVNKISVKRLTYEVLIRKNRTVQLDLCVSVAVNVKNDADLSPSTKSPTLVKDSKLSSSILSNCLPLMDGPSRNLGLFTYHYIREESQRQASASQSGISSNERDNSFLEDGDEIVIKRKNDFSRKVLAETSRSIGAFVNTVSGRHVAWLDMRYFYHESEECYLLVSASGDVIG